MTDSRRRDPTEFWQAARRVLPLFVGQPGQACTDADRDTFFGPDREAEAKAICNTSPCRWRQQCLQFALETTRHPRYDSGIWGGTTTAERHLIRRGKAQPEEFWSNRIQLSANPARKPAESSKSKPRSKPKRKRSSQRSKPKHAEPTQRSKFAPYSSAERARQMVRCADLRRQGRTLKEITQQVGIDAATALHRLRAAQAQGLDLGSSRAAVTYTPEEQATQQAKCRERRRAGMSIEAIARELNIATQTVRRRLRQAGHQAESAA
ncbi:WhiB family transcriptional regulator [Micromonospora echinofusca]|uniref:WhiB family transcriptional regulator n=1 Tax=Micromonospora echinofusca TaxID=47858 RepID=UPI0034429122